LTHYQGFLSFLPIAQGRERLENYQKHGATPRSFWFSQHCPQPVDEGVHA
jgi:hypothetical protein